MTSKLPVVPSADPEISFLCVWSFACLPYVRVWDLFIYCTMWTAQQLIINWTYNLSVLLTEIGPLGNRLSSYLNGLGPIPAIVFLTCTTEKFATSERSVLLIHAVTPSLSKNQIRKNVGCKTGCGLEGESKYYHIKHNNSVHSSIFLNKWKWIISHI